jgi:hypothetical protein
MKVHSIYRILNLVNGKSYIGYTSKPPIKRWWDHKAQIQINTKQRLYAAIRKYGIDNFRFDVLYQSLDEYHAHRVMEPHFIREYDTFGNNGYTHYYICARLKDGKDQNIFYV